MDYVHEHFTKKGLRLTGYPLNLQKPIPMRVIQEKDNEVVASLRWMPICPDRADPRCMFLENVRRLQRQESNAHKGIGKSLIGLFLREASRLGKHSVYLEAVSDPGEGDPERLFAWYKKIGAKPVCSQSIPGTNPARTQEFVFEDLPTVLRSWPKSRKAGKRRKTRRSN